MTELIAVPALRPHFRFQWEPAQDAYVLLYPEGMIKLNGSAGEILACVDGQQSIGDIVEALKEKFPDADTIEADTLEFFSVANDKRWIEFS
jgi:pyrroloquinoline quinone biosynthesis protein D